MNPGSLAPKYALNQFPILPLIANNVNIKTSFNKFLLNAYYVSPAVVNTESIKRSIGLKRIDAKTFQITWRLERFQDNFNISF